MITTNKKTAKNKGKVAKATKNTKKASFEAKKEKKGEKEVKQKIIQKSVPEKKEIVKNKVGCPPKINNVCEALESFLAEDKKNIWIMTDDELLDEVNARIADESKRICKRTFERYKQKSLNEEENSEELPPKTEEMYGEFCRLIKRALREQKNNLFSHLMTSDSSWQRFAWIIERKFDEWNLKKKVESEHNIGKRTMADLLDDLEQGKMT